MRPVDHHPHVGTPSWILTILALNGALMTVLLVAGPGTGGGPARLFARRLLPPAGCEATLVPRPAPRHRRAAGPGGAALFLHHLSRARVASPAITVTRIANAPIVLERIDPWRPTPAQLSRLTGDYQSEEIEGVQRIEAAGAGLAWRDPSGAVHPLEPIYRDALAPPDVS